jgi:predicted glycoside hydrolase/deacetylase ChbG (UPF0249 family)
MNISFVYPIYNEIENLPRLLPETRRIAEGLFPEYEVVLVDDGSKDGSGSFISQLAAEHSFVKALHHTRNRGLGAAIRTGLANATKDLVLYMDSDFPVAAEEAREALSLLTPEVDMLIGYRLGRAEGPRREVMSWTYNRLIRWGFGLHVRDVNFAFKVIRRPLLARMRLCSEGSFIDAEMLLEAQRLGARIREVGLSYHARVAGVSTAASMRVVWRILGEAWGYRASRGRHTSRPIAVIFNADDFGLCEAVNQGVAAAFDHGVVRSASILPTGEAFEQAVELARARPRLDIGVHLSLTQTRPVSRPEEIPSLIGKDGDFLPTWRAFLSRYLRGGVRKREVERELRAQLERAQVAGLSISHLDGHQHLHMLPGILPIVLKLAGEHHIGAVRFPYQRDQQAEPSDPSGAAIPGRASPPHGRRTGRRWLERAALRSVCRLARRPCGGLGGGALRANSLLVSDDFRGFAEAGAWDSASLACTIATIAPGVTEICCHPGADDGIGERFPWGYHWERELAALTGEELASAIRICGVEITSWSQRSCATR